MEFDVKVSLMEPKTQGGFVLLGWGFPIGYETWGKTYIFLNLIFLTFKIKYTLDGFATPEYCVLN